MKLVNLGKKYNLKLKISGLSSCPSFVINSEKWIKYKTYITQELLINKILGANTTYLSTSHNDKIIQKYINCLDKIFSKIKKCENNELDIDKILNSEVCHTGFKRLN